MARLSLVSIAELQVGVELASEARRTSRASLLLNILETLPLEQYDLTAAYEHARLLAHVHRSGRPRGAHDLILAATAIATGRTILTTDKRARFDDLPGVECIVV